MSLPSRAVDWKASVVHIRAWGIACGCKRVNVPVQEKVGWWLGVEEMRGVKLPFKYNRLKSTIGENRFVEGVLMIMHGYRFWKLVDLPISPVDLLLLSGSLVLCGLLVSPTRFVHTTHCPSSA